MKKEEIEKEIEKINNKITILETKRSSLEDQIQKLDLPFAEKFWAWTSKSNKNTVSDLFALQTYPNAYAMVDEREFDRYRVIYLLESFDEAFETVLNDPNPLKYYTQDKIDIIIGMAKEMMEGNFDSVEIDW